MLNGHQWQDRYPEFHSQSQALLSRAQECLLHLQLIDNDPDAIDCLIATLKQLGDEADIASVACVAGFSRQMLSALESAQRGAGFQDQTLQALNDCFILLAWQLELVDPRDGALMLDDGEQLELLANLASVTGSAATISQRVRSAGSK